MISVGFVVIGRNEGARLELCLRSALAVSRCAIYADSASTDGSVSTAERLGVAVVRLPLDGRLTAARGRNAGTRSCAHVFRSARPCSSSTAIASSNRNGFPLDSHSWRRTPM